MQRTTATATAIAIAALSIAACTKDPRDNESRRPQPIAPESVPILAQVELPSGRDLGAAAQMVDALQPGLAGMAGMMLQSMLPGIVETNSLNGAALDKPVRILALDPKTHPKPVVLVVTVADKAKLEQSVGKDRMHVAQDLALLGDPKSIATARMYALSAFPRAAAPEIPKAVVYVEQAVAQMGADLQQARARITADISGFSPGSAQDQVVKEYIEGLFAFIDQVAKAEIRLVSRGNTSGIELTLHPRAGSRLAQFCTTQKPSNWSLASKLPAATTQPVMFFAGDINLAAIRAPLVALMEPLMANMWPDMMNTADRSQSLDTYMQLLTGEYAAILDSWTPQFQLAQLAGVSDSGKFMAITHQWLQAMASPPEGLDTMGVKQTISYKPNAFVHDQINVSEQITVVDLSSMPPEERAAIEAFGGGRTVGYYAGFDSYLAFATSSRERITALIDAARGKAPNFTPQGQIAAAIASATAQQDSAVLTLDLDKLLAATAAELTFQQTSVQALILSLGFPRNTMRLFLGLAGTPAK